MFRSNIEFNRRISDRQAYVSTDNPVFSSSPLSNRGLRLTDKMESQLQTKQLLALFCFCLCFVAIANAMPAPQDPSQEEVLAKRLVDFQRWLYRMLDREARATYPMNLAALRELEGNLRLGMSSVKRGSDVPNRASRGGTLTGTNTLGQSGPRSNDNEGVLHIPQNTWTVALPSNGLVSYPGHSFEGGMGLCLWKVCPTAPWMRST